MTVHQARATTLNYGAKLVFVAICCGMIGGGVAGLRSQSFNMPERVRALEIQTSEQNGEVMILQMRQNMLSDEVAQLHGIGIGVGSALGILQIISLIAAWKSKV